MFKEWGRGEKSRSLSGLRLAPSNPAHTSLAHSPWPPHSSMCTIHNYVAVFTIDTLLLEVGCRFSGLKAHEKACGGISKALTIHCSTNSLSKSHVRPGHSTSGSATSHILQTVRNHFKSLASYYMKHLHLCM